MRDRVARTLPRRRGRLTGWATASVVEAGDLIEHIVDAIAHVRMRRQGDDLRDNAIRHRPRPRVLAGARDIRGLAVHGVLVVDAGFDTSRAEKRDELVAPLHADHVM